jgi:ribonuclease-3
MRIFTHRSFAARPTHVFEDSPEDPSPDNEQSVPPVSTQPTFLTLAGPAHHDRLEHVGDQVLGLIVTDLLQELFPYLRVGPSTVRRRARRIGLFVATVLASDPKPLAENAGARRW